MKAISLFRAGVVTLAIPVLLAASWTPSLAVAPPNDSFDNAITIDLSSLPYTDVQNITEATTEPGEPFYCNFSVQSVWYRFTPTSDMWIAFNNGGSSVFSSTSLYYQPGSTIFTLNFLRCSTLYDSSTVKVLAGNVYYMQATAGCCSQNGLLQTNLNEVPAPLPVANFFVNPPEPSVFDQVQFYDQSYDPGGVGITGWAWEFGDGTGDTGCCVKTHHYATDGDYLARLVVTTGDGRTAETTRLVSVRTRDVAITKFKVPQSASAGQTRQIEVGIRNTRYPETVRVELYRSVPGGYGSYEFFGSLTQFVPVRPSNRTTDFNFSYTFSGGDALIGKVTFRAVATLQSGRDALAADNEAISLPVKVSGGGNFAPPVDSTVTPTAPPVAPGEIAGTGLPGRLELRGVRPNPARADGPLSVRLALPKAGTARLQVLDLSGRVVSERDLGWLAPGVRDEQIAWERKPTPGIYWVRLSHAGESVSTRLSVLQ